MIKVNSTVKLNFPKINQLTQAAGGSPGADSRRFTYRS